jgi:hypothetical protein
MEDRAMHQRGQGLLHRFVLILALIGAIAGWGGVSARPALAQQKAEELFTPNVTARIVSTPDSLSGQRSDSGSLAYAEGVPPGIVVMGVRLVKQGEYAQAIALLEPYAFQNDFVTLHALGVAYVRTNRNREAYELLVRAHQLKPHVAGPLLPAALACARIARQCDEYRELALEYVALGGKFKRMADKIANYIPITLWVPKRY